MAHLSDYDTKNQFFAEVKKNKRLTPADAEEVRELILEVKDPSFTCKVDQSFGVLIDHKDEFGNKQHHRLYSVADLPSKSKGKTKITMLVKRITFVDEFSGEKQEGVASHYLCDRKVGDQITITGPYDIAFDVPEEKDANIILIGMGTGIAPFRAFIKHIYKDVKDFHGRILLFYGAKSGLELLYLNDKDGDLTNYYDEETFEAVHAFSPRPLWNDPVVLDQAIEDRADEIVDMLSMLNTYIYVAGYEKVKEVLEKTLIDIMGSEEKWKKRKAELVAGNKWAEIIY
ncbi:ferredoxin-NADP reductase [Ekhidna sp.]|uniref:ferredoxin-NADP reductase n=1 Tax=Ekhidna sp. TaxID=2608089 RepID=UPI003B50D64C